MPLRRPLLVKIYSLASRIVQIMREKEAYALLGWPHVGIGNDGDQWVAYRCLTPGCRSEGVARAREYSFGRCGICGAIMEVVDTKNALPRIDSQNRPNPAVKPASSAATVNVSKELASAQKVGEQLEELVVQRGGFPDDERNILLMAYWALIFDFHKAILALIPTKLYGSAFALVRPSVEALVRAHVAVKGSTADLTSLRDDSYRTDFDTIGLWIDQQFGSERVFTNFIAGAQFALHSYAHVGLSQTGRRFTGHDLIPSYDDSEVIEVIRITTSAVWMLTNLVTITLGFVKEANKAHELYIEWGKHR
jgi:hypothetical protein